MKSGQRILLILIVVFGGVIAYFSYSFLKSSKTEIYLFAQDYEAGTTITKEMLTTLTVDATLVDEVMTSSNEAKFVTTNDLSTVLQEGDTLVCDVYAGTPFMTTETTTLGGSVVERRLQDYKTALTLPVNNISGVSPQITAGAKINIYSSYSTENYQVQELLLQNVKILDVQATGDDESGYELSAITIQVDPDQALRLLYAINFQKIDISLLKSGKYTPITENSTFKVNTELVDLLLDGNSSGTSQGE